MDSNAKQYLLTSVSGFRFFIASFLSLFSISSVFSATTRFNLVRALFEVLAELFS